MSVIDTNVYLSRWPFRRLHGDEPADLAAKLRQAGAAEAWAGSFDALLHHDLGAVNARLAADCLKHGPGLLVPVGTVNPQLPDWRDELRRCHDDHRMPGIRLHPAYHGYKLDDSEPAQLLSLANERGMFVQIPVEMEDARTQHRLVQVPPVNLEKLPAILRAIPGLRVHLLNARGLAPDRAKQFAAAGNVYFDFAMMEGVHGLRSLAAAAPGRVTFGSYFPFYYFESAALKLKEAEVDITRLDDNARRIKGAAR